MAVDPARAKSLFLAASDLADPTERAAYLERECGGAAELRARVEALLRVNDAAPLPVAPEGTVDSANGQPEPEDRGDPTTRVGAILAGKYKLIEKIGAGGMGSVFLAQQIEPVKRAVAVKVIKAGMDSRAVLARFEAERQALALMDHPNIAKVLDAGTTDAGRSFFVMELVKGTPITRYCDEHKLTLRQRLELFVPVCQAIQHAHQKGIIHRDVKPSNVLVAPYDDRPVPKVIDFGLAKATGQALTDKTLMTGFGAIVGTPEYMSPEQASLNNLDVDTRSDVYSLGVLLYELLTGTTPLDKKSLGQAALLEILRIVREVEAPRPSARLSSSDMLPSVAAKRGTEPARLSRLLQGELDWLVLKALEKDRARRYDTANALARDIQRYLADEVVEARPPSVAYQLSKFVRRHKGQILAASLVLLALVGGIVGTTLGLFKAWRQEQLAREETGKKEEALRAEAQANDKLLTVGARGLLRPLAAQVLPDQPLPPLNDQEVEALWELATTTDERLRLRCVELALDDPDLRRRLKDRAPFAFQAAVGLDPTRGRHVEELLGKRLRDREIAPEEQEQVLFFLVHLGNPDGRLAARTADALIQAMSKTADANAFEYLAQRLAAVSARLKPKEAAEVAPTFTQAMSKTTDAEALKFLAEGLSALAARLEPMEAAQLCGQAAATLAQAMSKTTDLRFLRHLSMGMSAVAARLEPQPPALAGRAGTGFPAAEAAATLTQTMSRTTDPPVLLILAQGVSAVSAGLEPQSLRGSPAAEAAATLTQLLGKATDPDALRALAEGLSAVAARLEPKEAAQVCGQAAAKLTQAMSMATDPNALQNLGRGLSMLALRLEPKEAAQVCGQAAAILAQTMSMTTNPAALEHLWQGLSMVVLRLEPKEAAQVCGQAAAILARVMSKATDRNAWWHLPETLSLVAARLEPKEATEVAATLTQALSKARDPFALKNLAQGLSAVSARLESKEAAQVCGQAAATLTQAMRRTTDPNALLNLGLGLQVVVPRLEKQEAAQLCGQAAAALIQAMSRTTNPVALQELGQGLWAVADRMEPKDAAHRCGQAAAAFTRAMSKTKDPFALRYLSQGLAAVAGHLDPKAAAEVAATLTQALSKSTDWVYWANLGQGLWAVAARLEPKEAAQLCSLAAATLAQVMSKVPDSDSWRKLTQSLSAVVRELPPQKLVDLLKHPCCVGKARRLVLDQLAHYYHRLFADQWDFVDYVQQQKLDLDLTTPPARSRMLP